MDIKLSSDMPLENLRKVFGELKCEVVNEGNFHGSATSRTITEKGGVNGVTSLGREVFLVSCESQHINVYDATTLEFVRELLVPDLASKQLQPTGQLTRNTKCLRCVIGCSFHKCLYVSDEHGNRIHRVHVTDTANHSSWPTGVRPHGMSRNANHNVLVACKGDNTIIEYKTDGAEVRKIQLSSDITKPIHVIQLPSSQYGVVHHGGLHRYCVVDSAGEVVKSFGREAGCGDGQLNHPYGLEVNKRGYVFVASRKSDKILIIDPEVTAKASVLKGTYNDPYCLHLNEAQNRLYIGQLDGCLLVLDRACHADV
jgi:DNA-binding beta-propeller fold protein YncE